MSNFEEIPPVSVLASRMLADFYVKQGSPDSPFTKSGAKIVNMIIAIWKDLYPKEVIEWEKERKEYKESEKSIKDQVKQRTGRNLASYPYPIYRLLKVTFPEIKLGERKTCIKFVKKWPMFQLANRV